MSWFESGVFSRAAFTVIVITDSYPWQTLGFILSGHVGHPFVLASQTILQLVGFSILVIDCSTKHKYTDVAIDFVK